MNLAVFISAGIMTIAGAIGVVLAKLPVHQVLATVLNFIGLAVLYLSLDAEFMAVIQLIIYGGAVMILFLFVIALLTARKDPMERDQGMLSGQRLWGFAVGGALLLMLTVVALLGTGASRKLAVIDEAFGTVKHFGSVMLTTHVLPFELTAFVLMVAVVGVVILVGRQKA